MWIDQFADPVGGGDDGRVFFTGRADQQAIPPVQYEIGEIKQDQFPAFHKVAGDHIGAGNNALSSTGCFGVPRYDG